MFLRPFARLFVGGENTRHDFRMRFREFPADADDVVGVDDYSSYIFTVEAPYPMTYRVMCRYLNENGAGSESVEFKGGAN